VFRPPRAPNEAGAMGPISQVLIEDGNYSNSRCHH
jgi:hypothetical protein